MDALDIETYALTQELEAMLENEQMIRKRRAGMGYQTKRSKQSDIARHLERDYERYQEATGYTPINQSWLERQ